MHSALIYLNGAAGSRHGSFGSFASFGHSNLWCDKRRSSLVDLGCAVPESTNQDDEKEQIIRINVSGQIIETKEATLARFPNTVLGSAKHRQALWNKNTREYFLERHRPSFEAIFQFYQSGFLRRPNEVPLDTFIEELEWYGFDESVVDGFRQTEGYILDKKPLTLPRNRIKRKVWQLFEDINSSAASRVLGICSILATSLTVAIVCIETLPKYENMYCTNITTNVDGKLVTKEHPNFHGFLFYAETLCVAWFTIEYICRMLSCPTRRRLEFFMRPLNIVDLVTLIPYYLLLFTTLVMQSCSVIKRYSVLLVFRSLRVFRIFKLTRHSRPLQIFAKAVQNCIRELNLFLVIVLVSCMVLAAFVVVAEEGESSQLKSVPEGIWWAIATMTTVGYGDVYPVGTWGKLVGCVCFIMGCLVVALPTPVIVSNFNHFYRSQYGSELQSP